MLHLHQAHCAMTRPRNLVVCEYPVPEEVQRLMCAATNTIVFKFTDPTEALVRLLTCSPLAANPANMAYYPEASEQWDDYCNGNRWSRIHDALPVGAACLPAILFFDELNQDQKGFATGEGAIIVGGFFRREARESTYAKSSLGSFPPVDFPKVNIAPAICTGLCCVRVVL